MAKTIVISGGPGSGKTTIINLLKKRGYTCLDEVSRDIIKEAQKEGIDQLFLSDPEEFSKKVILGREEQFKTSKASDLHMVFMDRGIPDVIAYMDFKNEDSPEAFLNSAKNNCYDFVFLLPPWKKIYRQDNERYETFEEAQAIYEHLKKTYSSFGYEIVEVPVGNLIDRTNYILNIVEYS